MSIAQQNRPIELIPIGKKSIRVSLRIRLPVPPSYRLSRGGLFRGDLFGRGAQQGGSLTIWNNGTSFRPPLWDS
jgi:hypothetical protein